MRSLASRNPAFLIFLLLGALAGPVLAHDPPPIWLETRLEEGRYLCQVRVMSPLLDQWLNLARADKKVIGPDDEREIRERIARWFSERSFFAADDLKIDPVVLGLKMEQVEYHEFMIYYVNVQLEFPIAARPRTMTLEWRKEDFDIFDTWPMFAFDIEMGWDDELIVVKLDVEEPRFVWHAPKKAAPARVLPPPPPPPRLVSVPVLSVALLAGVLVFLPLSYVLRLSRRFRWSAVAVLLLAAVASAGVVRREMKPFWARRAAPLTADEALAIFESLHQNTYNAFRFEKEETIYDTLARSVDGALLERLYDEVYDGLIMREEGGVVCRVTNVKILKEELKLPDDPERREFAVDATWRVLGRVGHFGHTHVRLNRYAAHFLVRETKAGWRILDVEVRDQQRLEPDDTGLGGVEEGATEEDS